MHLILYNISKNFVRQKVSKLLEKEGYDRIQLSVFAGMHSPKSNTALWTKLNTYCQGNTSHLLVIAVGNNHFKSMLTIGSPSWDMDYITGEQKALII